MDSIVKKLSKHICSLILALTFTVIFYVLPLNGEMCSTIISAVDGEHFSALQKRAFFSFRSTCRRESSLQGVTVEGTSTCAQNTLLVRGNIGLQFQLPMTSLIRLEVTVSTDDHAFVYFSPDYPSFAEASYRVELSFEDFAHISKKGSSQPWISVDYKNGVFIGVPVIITYDNGRFEVAVKGVQDSTLTYDVTSPPQPSWFVGFYTYAEAELSFIEPCINDFNPKF